jgi:hypothetical protein
MMVVVVVRFIVGAGFGLCARATSPGAGYVKRYDRYDVQGSRFAIKATFISVLEQTTQHPSATQLALSSCRFNNCTVQPTVGY